MNNMSDVDIESPVPSSSSAWKTPRLLLSLSGKSTPTVDGDDSGTVAEENDERSGPETIIFHPGSSTLRFGLASSGDGPFAVPNCIARRLTGEAAHGGGKLGDIRHLGGKGWRGNGEVIKEDEVPQSPAKRLRGSNVAVEADTYSEPDELSAMASRQIYTDVSAEPKSVVGTAALNISPDEPYGIYWPIRQGRLNVQPGYSTMVALADIGEIWGSLVHENLGITSLGECRAVLVIPDIYERRDIELLVGVLLADLGFSAVTLQQESVSATFGAGLASACVIDIGAEKIAVCCVEDGVSLGSTRITLNYGGDDITRCLLALLRKSGFPYREIDLNRKADWTLMQNLKEEHCQLKQDDRVVQVIDLVVPRFGSRSLRYTLKCTDELSKAPMGLFFPRILNVDTTEVLVRDKPCQEVDPSDIHLTFIQEELNMTAATQMQVVKNGMDAVIMKEQPQTSGNRRNNKERDSATIAAQTASARMSMTRAAIDGDLDPHSRIPLDTAVTRSICKLGSLEGIDKMYSAILLVGDGHRIRGLVAILRSRLQKASPGVSQVEILTDPRGFSSGEVVWRGASVMANVEISDDIWVSNQEWSRSGPPVIREKVPFMW